MTEEESAFDPSVVLSAVSAFLLGEMPNLTREEVAERAGVSLDVARQRWRALGFPEVGDDAVAFTQADVEALKVTQRLIDLGVIQAGSEQAFIRTTGRTFARLAEWQVRALLSSIIEPEADADEDLSLELLDEIVPLAEQVQSYVWRRHLVGAAGRLMLKESRNAQSMPMCVGFADIVGYTSRSRRMSTGDLAAMVERFEEVASRLITDHRGRVIKTIGDEILFVVDEPRAAALLALDLLDEHLADETFPEVRVGLAYGDVLNRLGDVFGPVVNVASRLTSVAKPGRAVVDRALAEALEDDEELRLRRMRRTSVKGYENLEPWSLKRLRDEGDPGPRDAIEDALKDAATQVDEAAQSALSAMENIVERPPGERRSGDKDRRERKQRRDRPSRSRD